MGKHRYNKNIQQPLRRPQDPWAHTGYEMSPHPIDTRGMSRLQFEHPTQADLGRAVLHRYMHGLGVDETGLMPRVGAAGHGRTPHAPAPAHFMQEQTLQYPVVPVPGQHRGGHL